MNGPASVTNSSSTTGETMVYESDDNSLYVVVGNASEEDVHDPTVSHISLDWKRKLHDHDKQLQVSDKRHINAYSCFDGLLLHFYARVQDDERYPVDEAIELWTILSKFSVVCNIRI